MSTKRNDSDWKSILKCFSLTGYLGFLMIGCILGGFFIGWLIDKILGTYIIFKIIFLCLGIVGGFFNVYREITRRLE